MYNMKQAWRELKSFVTISFTITIITLLIIVTLKENWEMFQIVFTLFSSISSSVFAYYFTKSKVENTQDRSNKNKN